MDGDSLYEMLYKVYGNRKNIWVNLVLALAATPAVLIIGLIIITLIGALDDAITKIQWAGYWWVLLIPAYILSLIFFLCGPTFFRNHERRNRVNALILYWQAQLAKQNKPQPSSEEIKEMHKIFLERIKEWPWSDPELWPEIRELFFDIVDDFMASLKKSKKRK